MKFRGAAQIETYSIDKPNLKVHISFSSCEFKSQNNAFLFLVNIQILNSFICTDIAWQKKETFKLGSSLVRNLKLYLLVNLPPVCFLITQFRQASIEATKGRTNSKWFIQANNSSKKQMNKFVFLPNSTMNEFVRSFLEEFEDTKKCFQN